MKKKLQRNVLLSVIVLLLVIIIISCGKSTINPVYGHICRWNCPYKGVTKDQWHKAVVNKLGEESEGGDSYYIDMLHLQYPQDEYDELEDKLFKH